MGKIADELEQRLEYLLGIGKKWISGTPMANGESCVAFDYKVNELTYKGWFATQVLSNETFHFLDLFTEDYDAHIDPDYMDEVYPDTLDFNDSHSLQQRIWWLEEAVVDAKERGL